MGRKHAPFKSCPGSVCLMIKFFIVFISCTYMSCLLSERFRDVHVLLALLLPWSCLCSQNPPRQWCREEAQGTGAGAAPQSTLVFPLNFHHQPDDEEEDQKMLQTQGQGCDWRLPKFGWDWGMGRRRQIQPHPDCPMFPSSNEHLDLRWHEAAEKKDLSCL